MSNLQNDEGNVGGANSGSLDEKDLNLMHHMKQMMMISLAEHHTNTKGEMIDLMVTEMNKIKTEITQTFDLKVTEATTELGYKIDVLEEKNKNHDMKIGKLEKDNDYLTNIHRRKNIVVFGLEHANKNGYIRSQPVSEVRWRQREDKVLWLFRDKMQTSFRREDIDYIQDLSKDPGKEILLVRVLSQNIKGEIFSKLSLLKDSKIYLRDDLSKQEAEQRKFLVGVLKEKKKEGKQAYIKRNKLFVDGVEWIDSDREGGTQDEDHEMKDAFQSTPVKEINRSITKKSNKRPRPRDAEEVGAVKKQLSIQQFMQKHSKPRARSVDSAVSKIVKEIEGSVSQDIGTPNQRAEENNHVRQGPSSQDLNEAHPSLVSQEVSVISQSNEDQNFYSILETATGN